MLIEIGEKFFLYFEKVFFPHFKEENFLRLDDTIKRRSKNLSLKTFLQGVKVI